VATVAGVKADQKLRIENKIKPGIFDEKRDNAALLIKNSGFYFVRDPKKVRKELRKMAKVLSKWNRFMG